MNFLPVETFDHIVVGGTGKAWAVFELDEPHGMASYRFHADAAVVGYAQQILNWVRSLPLETRLLSVASPVRADDLRRAVAEAPDLIARVSPERRRALDEAAERAGDEAEARPSHRRRHFLCVTLDSADNLRSSAAEAMAQVSQLAGRRRPASSSARRRELLAAAELTATSLGSLARPATQDQIRWLLQRATRRGLDAEPTAPRPSLAHQARRRPGPSTNGPGLGGTTLGGSGLHGGAEHPTAGRPRPTTNASRPLLDAALVEGGPRSGLGLPTHRQMLRVESDDGVSWQTTLVLASMLPEWQFPQQGYWLAAADDFDFPIDVTMRVLSPPQHETRKQFRRRHKELASQPEQYAGTTTGVPDSVFDLIERSNAAQTALEGSRLNRIHRTLTCYTISADRPDELRRRVAAVKAELGSGGYELHAPTGDQRDLFFLTLPGSAIRPGGVVADYDLDLTAEAIASGLPGYTPELGDPRGALLGHRIDVGPATPVLLSPSVTTSASTMGFGASGGGKSFTAKTIALQELIGGAQVVAIDRTNRGEYVDFAAGLPGFLSSEVVDLSGDAQISLCPMSTFAPGDRVEITTSFLCLLAGIGARTMESARIAQAVEHIDLHRGTTSDVLELLRLWGADGDDLSRDLYYRITPLARTRFARLAFQPGTGVSVQGADLIVLHARGLVLPSKEEVRNGDDLDASKAASIAMVYLLMALADAIGNLPNRLSSIILDEAWAFLDSSFGIDLANRVLRDGRKDFKKLQLWSQHPADAPPDLLNMASNVFLTRQVEGAGAAALRMVGAEPTPELVSMIEQLAVGDMVMRDEYGRLGVIHVAPPVDPRTARSFDTRPRSGETGFAEELPAIEPEPAAAIESLPAVAPPEPRPLPESLAPPPPIPESLTAAAPIESAAEPERNGASAATPASAPVDATTPAEVVDDRPVPVVRPGSRRGGTSDLFDRLEASLVDDQAMDDVEVLDDDEPRPPRGRRLDVTAFVVPRS
ncbi:MAG: ATP-binding protein [Actinomycetota bacterium]